MAMSKKDYEQIASLLRASRAGVVSGINDAEPGRSFCRGALMATKVFAVGFANMAEEDNERFDRNRFLTACGVEDPTTITGLGGDEK